MKFSEVLMKDIIDESGMETPLDGDDVEYVMQTLWDQLDEYQGNSLVKSIVFIRF